MTRVTSGKSRVRQSRLRICEDEIKWTSYLTIAVVFKEFRAAPIAIAGAGTEIKHLICKG